MLRKNYIFFSPSNITGAIATIEIEFSSLVILDETEQY